jgi:hypothetical protein
MHMGREMQWWNKEQQFKKVQLKKGQKKWERQRGKQMTIIIKPKS